MLKDFVELNKQAAEKIREGIGKLSGQDVKATISEVKKTRVVEIKSFLKLEEKVAVLYIPITGELEGGAVLILPHESALAMADYLQKRELGTTHALTGLDISALKELANITVCNYLSVIANERKIESRSHGGRFSLDLFSAIAEEIITDLSKGQKEVYVMEIIFSFKGHDCKGDILFLFKDEKLNKLLSGGEGGSEEIYI